MTPVRPLQGGGGRARQRIHENRQQRQQGVEQQGAVGGREEMKVDEGDGAAAAVPMPDDHFDPRAKLGRPKDLLSLWYEFLHGLDGNKPAKDFTPRERGRRKTVYCHRKCFWDVMV